MHSTINHHYQFPSHAHNFRPALWRHIHTHRERKHPTKNMHFSQLVQWPIIACALVNFSANNESETNRVTLHNFYLQMVRLWVFLVVFTTVTVCLPRESHFNYKEVIRLSLLFYKAQRSGDLRGDDEVPWRGDSALEDKGENGEDLTGGYYDGW